MPKRNSEQIGNRGPSADNAARPEIGDMQVRRVDQRDTRSPQIGNSRVASGELV
ncbi:MAG: hypothetical protein ACXVHQ_36080 [Solirubrobacteraceae bacterium]